MVLTPSTGPLVFIKTPENVTFEEQVILNLKNGEKRIGNVIKLSEDITTIQIYQGTSGINTADIKTEFVGKPLMLKLAPTMLRPSFQWCSDKLLTG